jgi:pimeloyl-ACP methyl ester carboxylesterase
MSQIKNGQLSVPGASLYYEVRGSGPMLLLLPGGDGDASAMNRSVEGLSVHYTVVTYDRRGLSRSKIEDGMPPVNLPTHADDAHRLLRALTEEPAFVFGTPLGQSWGSNSSLSTRSRFVFWSRTSRRRPSSWPNRNGGPWNVPRSRSKRFFVRRGLALRCGNLPRSRGWTSATTSPTSRFRHRARNELPIWRSFFRTTRQRFAFIDWKFSGWPPLPGKSSLGLAAPLPRMVLPGCAAALASALACKTIEFEGGHNGSMAHPKAFAARLHAVLSAPQYGGAPESDRSG